MDFDHYIPHDVAKFGVIVDESGECIYKKYLDSEEGKKKYGNRCIWYWMFNDEDREFCKEIDCKYRPKTK